MKIKKLPFMFMSLCTLIVMASVIMRIMDDIKYSIDSYINNRINDAIAIERHYVYEDLEVLNPSKVHRTKNGLYVIQRGNNENQ